MSEAIVYRVPGRINFIGEHTDYNLGFVLPGAIDLGLTFRMKKATGVHTEIRSLLYGETARCDALGIGLKQPWTIFFRRTLELLRSRGYQIGPVTCEFGGDLPSGAGLSSSSAITCGFIHGLNHLFELGLSQMDIVQVASEAERGSGVEGGQMDQYAITFGEKGSLLYLDCRSMTHESVNTDLGDYQLVLWNTKVEHSLIDSGYNDRHHDCRRGLHMLQAKDGNIHSIRDISLERLQSMKSELDPVSYQRILYVLQENDRVEATVAALKANDLEVAGELLYESHHGL
ncbi:MAG: galactokinase family protein, partial [Bacteroidota bacterium]